MNNSYKIGIPFVTFFVILGFIFDESFFILSLGCLLFFGICGVAIDICNFIESKEHREIVKERLNKKMQKCINKANRMGFVVEAEVHFKVERPFKIWITEDE